MRLDTKRTKLTGTQIRRSPALGVIRFRTTPAAERATVFIGPWDITDLWIVASLGLWVVIIALGATQYTPTLRRQIAALDASGASSPEYVALQDRGNRLGMLVGLIVLVIIGLMVLKPTL